MAKTDATPKPAATDTPQAADPKAPDAAATATDTPQAADPKAPDAAAVETDAATHWDGALSIEEGSLHEPGPKPDTPDEAPASDEDLETDEDDDEAANTEPSTDTDEETPSDEAEPEPEPGEGEAETEDSEAEPDTDAPAFNPADYGLDQSYGQCKTLEEALKLADTRRASAESYAKREANNARRIADDLAALRSGSAPKAEAEPDAAGPAKPGESAEPQPWTPEQRRHFQQTLDEQPEAVVDYLDREITRRVLADVDGRIEAGLKAARQAERDAEAKRVAGEAAKVDLVKLYEDHPDARSLVEAGDFERMAAALGGRYDFPTLYEAVTLQRSDPETFAAILPDLRLGHTVGEARKRAADAAKAVKYDALAKKAAARKADEARRHASPSSSRTARTDAVPVDAIGIENL